MAMGVLRALAEAGRGVPDDVSVVGFDDVPEAEFQMVPLTTVGIDADASAERILAELVHMIEGGEPAGADVELTADLVIRRSAGPPPKGHKLSRSVRLIT
jgi:DNA-binding LacI/PurR family transcriptional regulator